MDCFEEWLPFFLCGGHSVGAFIVVVVVVVV